MKLVLFFLALSSKVFGLYLLTGDVPEGIKKRAYHEVLVKEDYPCCLMAGRMPPSQEEMDAKLKKIDPKLKSLWVPTSLFQLYALHAFFSDGEFRSFVQCLGHQLGLNKGNCKEDWGKVNVDEEVVGKLKHSLSSIYSLFDEINHRERICSFFIRLNVAFCKAYSEKLLEELLAKIPTLEEAWKESSFPFYFSYAGKENVALVRRFLKENREILRKAISEEWQAEKEGKHLIYRGAEVAFFYSQDGNELPVLFLPLKAKRKEEGFAFEKGMSSFSLSYAASLFGGLFLSTDACAARYAVPSVEEHYAFHALKLDEKALDLFCIPPLHPFAEMLIDGEWFHPHAKIAYKEGDAKCHGWYADINRSFQDPSGFIIRKDISPEELGQKLLKLAKENAVIFHLVPKDMALPLENHLVPLNELPR